MTRIIKIENVIEEKINEYLGIMQIDLHAEIQYLQCYGENHDCYMIVYRCEEVITMNDILDNEAASLGE